MSVQSNIAFFQGEDITINFQLAVPQDITGWSFLSSVYDKLGGTLQFHPTVTYSSTTAGRGKFTLTWPRGNTSTLVPGDYVWDVRRTDAGFNSVLAHGEATVRQAITP